MDNNITNTQDLLREMDNITGDDPDVSFNDIDNTQQIVSNIDRITASQVTNTGSDITQTDVDCSDKQGEVENPIVPTYTSYTDCSHKQEEAVNQISSQEKNSLMTQCEFQFNNETSNTECLQHEHQKIDLKLVPVTMVTGMYDVKDSTEIVSKSMESSEDSKTLIVETSHCEPPSKKLKVNQAESQSVLKPAFQFVPRNVHTSQVNNNPEAVKQTIKKQEFVKTISNTSFDDTETKGDNLKIKSHEQTVQKESYSKKEETDSLLKSDMNTSPYKFKSYDANVVLPPEVVKTWRTSCDIKEGEVIEIESDCDSIFTSDPVCFAHVVTDFSKVEDNYLRGCKWSPDGTCLLTNSNDNKLRIYNIPTELMDSKNHEITSNQIVKESDTVYDFCWYNKMSSADPDSCCFLTTCKDSPVHMWDMNTGKLKCTYRPYNHLDEMTTAHSLCLSLDGNKLYTGFNRMIRVFDVSRPGRQCIQRPTFVKHQGQPGIISCIAASPQGGGIYAAGSYARAIALYHEPDGNMLCMFEGQQGGVTHIAFSPDGTKLYSGGRKDPEILCWDLRKPGQILFVVLRLCETNQRLYFDQDGSGRHLVSGCHDGAVSVWDTSRLPVKVLPESDPLLKLVMKFKAHRDCVNGVSINPKMNVLASCSGQRHYPDLGDSDDSDNDSVDININTKDNSVKLWKFKS